MRRKRHGLYKLRFVCVFFFIQSWQSFPPIRHFPWGCGEHRTGLLSADDALDPVDLMFLNADPASDDLMHCSLGVGVALEEDCRNVHRMLVYLPRRLSDDTMLYSLFLLFPSAEIATIDTHVHAGVAITGVRQTKCLPILSSGGSMQECPQQVNDDPEQCM
jgi:hypothetical protein